MLFFYYEWNTGRDPEKDGIYYVARLVYSLDPKTCEPVQHVSVDTFEYTTAGGWNTRHLADGTIFTDHAVNFDGRVIYWTRAKMVKEEELKKWYLTSPEEN